MLLRESRGVVSPSLGTRFLVFPQPPFIHGYERPEIVWVSAPAGRVLAGPADDRIVVRDPLLPKPPYSPPYMPPFAGDVFPPPTPGPTGHFDHISSTSRQFISAHVYACIRRVIDVFESYRRHPIPWHFGAVYERLEVIAHLPWHNAQSGMGFMELGEPESEDINWPFALNFDIVAHETGHLILLGILGPPPAINFENPSRSDLLAFHEAFADLSSKLSLLHFDTALDLILRRTAGNLYVLNELDRIGPMSPEHQIRLASHSLRLSDVGLDVHDRSRPMTGALFDTLLEIFQSLLYERDLSDIDPRAYRDLRSAFDSSVLERALRSQSKKYQISHFAFKSALEEARDMVGEVIARSLDLMDVEKFSFQSAAQALIAAATHCRGQRFTGLLASNLAWRELIQ
jgi:hypothetical protein